MALYRATNSPDVGIIPYHLIFKTNQIHTATPKRLPNDHALLYTFHIIITTANSNTTPTIFNNPDLFSGTLRVIMKGNDPWFVAKDVCDALGLKSHNNHGYSHHFRKLNKDEVTPTSELGVILPGTGMQYSKAVSESGLYKLIMRSDKPAAKAFQDWVTRIVLPTLRKDGMYVMGEEKVITGELEEAELILKVVTLLNGKVERLSSENAKLGVHTSILRHETAEGGP